MKKSTILFVMLGILSSANVSAQLRFFSDSANGDWAAQHIILTNTSEADLMVRAGDIDNLGFGWPSGFDPFSGFSTPGHGFPWAVDTSNAMGTDRIMVISSYKGSAPYGQDGYTGTTSRPANLPRPVVLNFELNGLQVNNAALQVFVDDFQAPVWHANYYVTLNGKSAPYFADVINALSQTGPIGKMVTINIPQQDLYLLQRDSLSVFFNDSVTGAGDGFAIDFVKLLINTSGYSYTASVSGYITETGTGNPIESAIVSASSIKSVLTDANGYYHLTGLPAGINQLMATKFSYDTATLIVDLQAGQSAQRSFQVKEILDAEFMADHLSGFTPFTVSFMDMTSLNPTTWLWDFGDGNTSNQQNPSHTYLTSGVFTVVLKASNSTENSTETKTGYISTETVGIKEYDGIKGLTVSPNPLTSSSLISYELTYKAAMKIAIYGQNGQKVRSISDGSQAPGKYSFKADSKSLKPGIYYLVFDINGQSISRKIVVSR